MSILSAHSLSCFFRCPAARVLLAGIMLLSLARMACAEVLIHLNDGRTVTVDEAWEDPQGVWYRRNGISQLIERSRVLRIERVEPVAETKPLPDEPANKPKLDAQATIPSEPPPVWIHLVGGARMEVEDVTETADGVWYKRGNLNRFLERARVEQIVREILSEEDPVLSRAGDGGGFGWTTGRANLDALIQQNGARYNVDPYLIFCVMEQESSFGARAVSPVGARGLMQLMPGTAARFGVRNSFDPAQNIAGGTRYLKELLQRFSGSVELALAGYNAGEGAVMKYGHRVPPYRETRNYVRRIGARYAKKSVSVAAKTE